MESLGDKLKNTRLEKDLTLDRVSRETNISLRYLEAMETENFSVFPGEPYVLGFLKNYGSYLDLDVQKVISLYRALRIQEQPMPVEQLLKKKSQAPKIILTIFIILIVLGAGGWGIFTLISGSRLNPGQNITAARAPAEHHMEGTSMERRLYRNDSVLVHIDSETYKLELSSLGEAVTISTPGGSRNLDLGQEITFDLNNDGIPELRITLADFARNRPEMGALLHFIILDTAVFTGSVEMEPFAPVTGSAAVNTFTVIPASVSPYPFTLQISFQGYCMFRWEILNERDRRGTNQRYFQRGEQLDIQAQNGIRLWVSSAQAARFQVIGGGRTYPLEIGSSGEVVVTDIRWVRDEDSRFRLIVLRLETGS